MEKKDTNKIIIAIIVIAIIIAVVGGSTFAYWAWVTSAAQQTNVSATVKDSIVMTITPTTTQTDVLYPVSRTNCATADIEGTALVRIENYTDVLARPQFYLKLQIIDSTGENVTSKYVQYINFAVTDPATSSTGTTCANAKQTGKFTTTVTKDDTGATITGWYNSPIITVLTGTGDESSASRFPILPSTDSTSMTFDAPAANTCYNGNTELPAYTTRQACVTAGYTWKSITEHTFNFWLWIDSTYTTTNTGTTISDELQDAKITISWSETSGVKQVQE